MRAYFLRLMAKEATEKAKAKSLAFEAQCKMQRILFARLLTHLAKSRKKVGIGTWSLEKLG